MSVIVTFNATDYVLPTNNEVGWGTNTTAYFIGIAAGCLQKSGGSFTLSAETDFGASFGLKSLYYKSRSSNIATAGILRLNNNSDAIKFRNAANSGDLSLLVNASDQLQFNGTPVNTLSIPISVANGGTGNTSLTTYAVLCGGTTSTGAIQSVAGIGASGQVLTSNGAGTLPTFQNVSGTGTVNSGTAGRLSLYPSSTNIVGDTYVQNTHNITLTIATQASRSVDLALTIPNPGNAITSANIVLDQGNTSLAGTLAVTAASLTALTVGSTDLIVDTTNHRVGVGTAPTTAFEVRTDQSAATIATVQNMSTNAAAAARIRIATNNSTIGPALFLSTNIIHDWYLSVDPADSDKFKMATSAALTNPAIVINATGPAVAIHGTVTNDSATIGFVGETVTSSPNSYINFPASNTVGDFTSIFLTAGDWLVTAILDCLCKSSTNDVFYFSGISTTSGNSGAGIILGDNAAALLPASGGTVNFSNTISVSSYRMSLSSPTIVYLKFKAQYTSTAPQANGRISAVRIR